MASKPRFIRPASGSFPMPEPVRPITSLSSDGYDQVCYKVQDVTEESGPAFVIRGAARPQAPAGVDAQIYEYFCSVDTDHSGHISVSELQKALLNGKSLTEFSLETCRLMIGMFDRDKSGELDALEFQELWNFLMQWSELFVKFDSDRSGTIEAEELEQALIQLGFTVPPGISRLIVSRYDPVNKRSLALDHFIQTCVFLKNVTSHFLQNVIEESGVIEMSYEDCLKFALCNKP